MLSTDEECRPAGAPCHVKWRSSVPISKAVCFMQAALASSLGSSRCGAPCSNSVSPVSAWGFESSADGGSSHQHTILAEWEERAEALEQRDAARLHTLEAALMREQREVRAHDSHVQGGSEVLRIAFKRKLK